MKLITLEYTFRILYIVNRICLELLSFTTREREREREGKNDRRGILQVWKRYRNAIGVTDRERHHFIPKFQPTETREGKRKEGRTHFGSLGAFSISRAINTSHGIPLLQSLCPFSLPSPASPVLFSRPRPATNRLSSASHPNNSSFQRALSMPPPRHPPRML